MVDSGFFHLLDPAEADLFVADLARALPPGGRYYLHEFDVEFPLDNTPPPDHRRRASKPLRRGEGLADR